MLKEIQSIKKEREEQSARYLEEIKTKDESNRSLADLNESLRFENQETECRLRL